MEPIDVINLVRRANFTSSDYRIKINMYSYHQGTIERYTLKIYIGHLARLGRGTPVFDVAYSINLNTEVLRINYIYVFREGNWISVLEKDAARGDALREEAKAIVEKEKKLSKSPINDKRLFGK